MPEQRKRSLAEILQEINNWKYKFQEIIDNLDKAENHFPDNYKEQIILLSQQTQCRQNSDMLLKVNNSTADLLFRQIEQNMAVRYNEDRLIDKYLAKLWEI